MGRLSTINLLQDMFMVSDSLDNQSVQFFFRFVRFSIWKELCQIKQDNISVQFGSDEYILIRFGF